MRQAEVAVGSVYVTRVSGQLVAVQVLHEQSVRVGAWDKQQYRTAFRCKRRDTGALLPKPRKACSLRHTKGSRLALAVELGLRAVSQ